MSIIEAIETRRSVRSYDGTGITDAEKRAIESAISDIYNPFGGSFTIKLKSFGNKETYKPSTYGIIRGAQDFFLVGYADDKLSELATGFCFEKIVLKSWQIGLGTCWIAATFKGSDFEKGEDLLNGHRLKIISPVGVPAKKSLIEKISRFAVGSDKRKPFDKMFFYKNFNTPIPENNKYRMALEMLRMAPSSTNSQPWRVLVDNNTVHFYYSEKGSLSILDTGIGICHFYETEKYNGREGKFVTLPNTPVVHERWKYLVTYIGK